MSSGREAALARSWPALAAKARPVQGRGSGCVLGWVAQAPCHRWLATVGARSTRAIWDDASGVPMPCLCLPLPASRGAAVVQRPGRGKIKSCCTPSPVSPPSAHRQGPTRAPAEKCPKRTSKTGSIVVYFWPCPPGGDLHQRRVEPCEARFEPCLRTEGTGRYEQADPPLHHIAAPHRTAPHCTAPTHTDTRTHTDTDIRTRRHRHIILPSHTYTSTAPPSLPCLPLTPLHLRPRHLPTRSLARWRPQPECHPPTAARATCSPTGRAATPIPHSTRPLSLSPDPPRRVYCRDDAPSRKKHLLHRAPRRRRRRRRAGAREASCGCLGGGGGRPLN